MQLGEHFGKFHTSVEFVAMTIAMSCKHYFLLLWILLCTLLCTFLPALCKITSMFMAVDNCLVSVEAFNLREVEYIYLASASGFFR